MHHRPPKFPPVDKRQDVLTRQRQLKMARSAHAYVRGNTAQFYAWLQSEQGLAMPQGPAVWIYGDCHVGNLGPVADAKGRVVVQIRDLDQTVVGNPAHDLIRLGLSLASAARGSDLPGVTTAKMIERMVEGYEQAFLDVEESVETTDWSQPAVVASATSANAPAADGGLTKLGAGTLTLSGANTYTGNTTVSAGTLAVSGSIGSGGAATLIVDGASAAGATLSLASGGSVSVGRAIVGLSGAGVVIQTGGSLTTNGNGLTLGDSTGASDTYTLGGGTLTVSSVASSGGTGTFHFAGGTLQAARSTTTFLRGLTTADVQAGGARIDTQNYNVTLAQNLLRGTADGGLTKSLSE